MVDDVNDNPPIFDFDSYDGHLPENSPPGTEVILRNRISTHDVDDPTNRNSTFTLLGDGSELFSVDKADGRVFFDPKNHQTLDREAKSVYSLQIVADDRSK